MGTHSAMAIVHPIGIWEVERTLDGSMLIEAAQSVVDTLIETGELLLPDADDIGSGGTEFNEERERCQEYFMAIDPHRKLLWLDSFTMSAIGKSLLESCRKVIELYDRRGWEVSIAYDTIDVEESLARREGRS